MLSIFLNAVRLIAGLAVLYCGIADAQSLAYIMKNHGVAGFYIPEKYLDLITMTAFWGGLLAGLEAVVVLERKLYERSIMISVYAAFIGVYHWVLGYLPKAIGLHPEGNTQAASFLQDASLHPAFGIGGGAMLALVALVKLFNRK